MGCLTKNIKMAAFALGILALTCLARPYIVGVDVSWVLEDESLGATYYDDGKKMDLFDILQNNGINFIRLRTFVNSCNGYAKESYSGANSNVCWCDLEHTIVHAKRIKAHNMGFLLDFHMSDTWASIGKQYVPAAWKGKSDAEMQKLAYEHVKQTLDTLVKLGLKPNMVQVGNEINSSMSGVSISNPERFAALVNAGVKAVRETDPNIKIVMQHGRPRPDGKFMDWYNTLKKYVDFDVIGGSTYGTTNNGDDWREMFGNVVADGHEVVSLEYTGQRTKLINSVMFDMPHEMGLGTFVWEPTRYSDYPMFDRNGQKYTANARLKELAAIAKQYKATLPNWVTGANIKKFIVKATAAIGGKIERSTESDSVAEGSKVKLTAKPLDGWEFSGWVGDNAPSTAEFEIANVNSPVTLHAEFKFVGKDSLHYEAENAIFENTIFENKHEGFSGSGYANLDNAIGSAITFAVCIPQSGKQNVNITFANGAKVNRPVSIAVNGKVQIENLDLGPTGEWSDWASTPVTLDVLAGANSITIKSLTADGAPNIDKIEFAPKPNENTTHIIATNFAQKVDVQLDKNNSTLRINHNGAPGNVALIDANGKVIFKRELSRGNSAETFALPAMVKGRVNFVIVNVGKSRKTLLW